jgi:hypothetical protein
LLQEQHFSKLNSQGNVLKKKKEKKRKNAHLQSLRPSILCWTMANGKVLFCCGGTFPMNVSQLVSTEQNTIKKKYQLRKKDNVNSLYFEMMSQE